jgi:hypothetical protein
MRYRKMLAVLAACAFLFAPVAPLANAQILSPTISTTVTYSQGESLTVSTDTPSLALTTSPQAIHVTASWSLSSARSNVMIVATFNSPSTALTGLAGNTITTAEVLGQGLDSEQPCNEAPPAGSYFAANGYNNMCDTVINSNTTGNEVSSVTKPFEIRISPSAAINPDSYTGTLLFVGAAM